MIGVSLCQRNNRQQGDALCAATNSLKPSLISMFGGKLHAQMQSEAGEGLKDNLHVMQSILNEE